MSEKNTVLSSKEIMERIPHRYPILLVDKMIFFEHGVRGVGVKCVSSNEGVFQGHFPGQPIMPGALIMESMAQTAAVVLGGGPGKGQGTGEGDRVENEEDAPPPMLLKVDRLKFVRPVLPGDSIEIEVVVKKRFGRMVMVEAWARVEKSVVSSAVLTLSA